MAEPGIDVLEGLAAVRMRPEMYLASLQGASVADGLLLETLCHAFDEAIEGNCTEIVLALSGDEAVVTYDAGLPLCRMENGMPAAHVLLATLYACKARKRHISVGDEVCKAGLAVANALSATFEVKTTSSGESCTLLYSAGELLEEPRVQPSTMPDQTRIHLELDSGILGPHQPFSQTGIEVQLQRISMALPKRPAIRFNATR